MTQFTLMYSEIQSWYAWYILLKDTIFKFRLWNFVYIMEWSYEVCSDIVEILI